MSCCSTHCERYWICARAYESGSAVNWHEYGSGGYMVPSLSYCGPDGSYGLFQPADPSILENKIAAYQVALERLRNLLSQEEKNEDIQA